MNALEITGLRKQYQNKKKDATPAFALQGLDLTLPCGCILGLVGENGAGKSTTIKLILDMLRRDGGSVRIFGQDSRTRGPLGRAEIGVVLDDIGLPEYLSAREVGAVMAGIYPNWDAAAFAGYLGRFALSPTMRLKEYSRGMRMKLGIAVALSHQARLLLLDEATGGLDPLVRDEVTDLFGEFTRAEDHAVLISSHIVSDLEKICDYIAFLHRGQLLLCGEKDRLHEEYGLLHCSAQTLAALPAAAVLGKKEGPYGVQALVKKAALPAGLSASPADLEQMFIFMVKEAS